jgi:phosphoribosylformylglycinamidine synthase II
MARTIELINTDDNGLMKISKDGLLSLNLEEMQKIRDYFKKLGRNPTDAELDTLAQTWSEHCVHKTFNGIISMDGEEIDSIFKTYIARATKELNKPWCVCVFKDNAGIVEFNDKYDLAFKVETHNHPTALDPYGGAGTGSGGVFRDVMGVGAKPILSTDVLFFGPPTYPHSQLPQGVMHPKRLMKGSVAGIRDYGNRMGIPTANGGFGFDRGYIGNPLIYAGVVGIMPKGKYVTSPKPGDIILLVGGKTGRDGIHGVTFASLELDTDSEKTSSGAVQIGNPIEEKKSLDGLIRARDAQEKPLYSAVTDCGGGGLSSAVGEMGRDLGIDVDLDQVPLKYAGLEPWEIWISEAQERMLFEVPPENLEAMIYLFKTEDSDATPIGRFRDDKKLILRYDGEEIANLDMDFVHGAVPRVRREAHWDPPQPPEPDIPEKEDYTSDLKRLLAMPNIASKEWVIRQYDHEVQGKTVVKPIAGVGQGPSDACVMKPVYDTYEGIVVSNGVNSRYSSDPYNMALSSIDEAIRNNVACGGRRLAILDNFSWGNPEKPDRLAQLVLATKACYDGAVGFGTPFISGKDSLYNEYATGNGETVSVPPTLLISALGIIPDIRKAVTMDLKSPGNPVYIIGETKDEMGGSHYLEMLGFAGGSVPGVDVAQAKKSYDALINAMDAGYVRACHDCSEGGFAVAAAEMAFAGNLGLHMDIDAIPSSTQHNAKLLFSESNSRLIVEVSQDKQHEFEAMMAGVACANIGEVTDDKKLIIMQENRPVISSDVGELREAWGSTFNW